MRLGFCGSPSFAVPVLDALVAAGHEVTLVVTRPDKRRGRGGATSPTAVKARALELGIEVADDVKALLDAEVDLGIVVAYGAMVPTPVLDHLQLLNLHLSLLPRWRGAAPVERAILAGDERTGVCVMGLEPTLDTGPIFAVEATDVDDKYLSTLRDELIARGTSLLVELLAGGAGSLPTPVPQVGEGTYAKKVVDAELELDFTRTALELGRVVRIGRARTSVDGRRLVVRRAEVLEDAEGSPGELEGDVVACGEGGGLRLLEIVPEGRKAMAVADWRRGLRTTGPILLGATR